MWANVLY
jgi:hypothetical protein